MIQELIPYTHCPLCNSQNFTVIKTADCSHHPRYNESLSKTLDWNLCLACQHIFRNSYYTDEALSLIFQGTNPQQMVGYQIEAQRYVSAKMIEKVLPYQDHGIWMDVGFGNGSLLFTALEHGFEPFGLDLRKSSVDAIQQYKISALCCDINALQPTIPMSVISLCDVLEHIPYPLQALEKCHELLKEDGVLFISMPNTESMAWFDLDQHNLNPYWGEIEHYHNFSRSRLYQLLEEKGFQAVRYGISERYRVCMEVIAVKKSL